MIMLLPYVSIFQFSWSVLIADSFLFYHTSIKIEGETLGSLIFRKCLVCTVF